MSASDHLVNLILNVKNGQAFKDLKAEAVDQRAALDQLTESYTKGEITSATYLQQAARLARELEKREKILRDVERAENAAAAAAVKGGNAADGASSKAAGSYRHVGQAVTDVGRIAQDAQYGFSAVVNNLESFARGAAQMFGASAATGAIVGGVAQLVGVGIQIATPIVKDFLAELSPEKTDPFKGAVDDLTERIDKLKEGMKDASKSPIDIAVNRSQILAAEADLERLKRAQAAFNAQAESKTKDAAESESRIKAALAGTGVEKAIKSQALKQIEETDPAILAAKDELERIRNEPVMQDALGQGQRDHDKAVQAQEIALNQLRKQAAEKGGLADRMTGSTLSGDPANLAKVLRSLNMGDLADKVDASTPEAIAIEKDQKENERRTAATQAKAGDAADAIFERQEREDAEYSKRRKARIQREGAAADAQFAEVDEQIADMRRVRQKKKLKTDKQAAFAKSQKIEAETLAKSQEAARRFFLPPEDQERLALLDRQRAAGFDVAPEGMPRPEQARLPKARTNRERIERARQIRANKAASAARAKQARPRTNLDRPAPRPGGGLRSVPASPPGANALRVTAKTLDVQGQTLKAMGGMAQIVGAMTAKVANHERLLGQITNFLQQTNTAQRRGRQ